MPLWQCAEPPGAGAAGQQQQRHPAGTLDAQASQLPTHSSYTQPPQQQHRSKQQQLSRAKPPGSRQRYGPTSSSHNDPADSLQQSTTPLVWLVVWSVGCAGFLVGYVQGAQVAISESFRELFLPQLPDWHGSTSDVPTCTEQISRLSWYLSPKYLAGFLAALPIGWVIRVTGRRFSLGLGCAIFVLAQLLRGTTSNLAVLLVGQAVDGIACAFLYQAPYLEAVEVAPPKWRGAFGYSIQLGRAIGLFCRGLLVQGIAMQPNSPTWGWRLGVLFPIWPACVIMMLVPLLPETPNSLMQRGQLAAARAALQEIRGPLVDVEEEFNNILEAAGIADGQGQSPLAQFRTLVQREQLPPLLILLVMTVLREYTGADFLLTYSQALRGMGLGFAMQDTTLTFVLRQLANVGYFGGALLGALLVDTWGRRPIFLLSSAGGAVFYTLLAAVLTAQGPLAVESAEGVPQAVHVLMQAGIILAFACYSLAWGICYFVLMAEIFPLATRSLAMSLTQGLTFCMYSIAAGTCLKMLCEVHLGLLWLFAATNVFATVFVYLCLPETKRVPLEEVGKAFKRPPHWLWRHFFTSRSSSINKNNSNLRARAGVASRAAARMQAAHRAHYGAGGKQ